MAEINIPTSLINSGGDCSSLTLKEKEDLSYSFEQLNSRLVDRCFVEDENTRCGCLFLYKMRTKVYDIMYYEKIITGDKRILLYGIKRGKLLFEI